MFTLRPADGPSAREYYGLKRIAPSDRNANVIRASFDRRVSVGWMAGAGLIGRI